jgi:integrase
LCEQEGIAAAALRFCILTAARLGEVTGARWDEFDLNAGVWTVPGERMKAGKPHRIPLSDGALAILKEMKELHPTGNDSAYVFPGGRSGRALSNAAAWHLLRRRMGMNITTHGFRSSFSTWAHEHTNYNSHVIELSLAHTVGSAVERAYRRTDLFEQRRRLMDEWARYCTQPAPVERGEVVALRAG